MAYAKEAKSHEMTIYKGFQMVGFTYTVSAYQENELKPQPSFGTIMIIFLKSPVFSKSKYISVMN